jgi:hypothetical protein
MTELDFESDAFLVLLTDALRAGPGSPSWHDALQKLRAGGIESGDEYRLLATAREHLESGREYRSVRAGPEFTRRLMSAIDEQAAQAARKPATATIIAIVSAAVMLGVLLLIGYLLWTGGDASGPSGGSPLLPNTIASIDFSRPSLTGWQSIGALNVDISRNLLRVAPSTNPAATGTGLVWNSQIAADEPFSVTAAARILRADNDLILQVFVTDDPDFSEENGTTPHELVCLLKAGQAQAILPSGRVEAQVNLAGEYRGMVPMRVTLDRDQAVIEVAGRAVWSGLHGLDPLKPRFAGIRFLKGSAQAADGAAFQSVRINTRQK